MISNIKRVLIKLEPYYWLIPSFVLFFLFTFYPFVKTLFHSVFIVDTFGNRGNFVLFDNYKYILTDPIFIKAVRNTIIFTLITVPISKIIALVLALLANKKRGTSFIYEPMFTIPIAVSSAVIAMIFQLMYVPSLGIINSVFNTDINWLTDPKYALISIAIVQIWLSTGYGFMFLLAAVRNVPQEILENATLEGLEYSLK